jgi:hypothetical protein
MPIPKVLLEDGLFRIRRFIFFYCNGKRHRTVLFYPSFPSKRSVLHKIFMRLRYNITNNPTLPHDVIIYWEDTTYRRSNELIEQWAKNGKVINQNSRDISKSHVDKVFQQVFGYGSMVDPISFEGLMVKKSELNARHDGVVIQGPVVPEEGFIYQKLINNECGNDLVEDMRIPIFNGLLPLVFVKYKNLSTRFGLFRKHHHRRKNTELFKAEDLLSHEEVDKLKAFCRLSGLEYGELDVLRDKTDQRIYVVDVNNTPTGPPYMKKQDRRDAMKTMTNTLFREFLV